MFTYHISAVITMRGFTVCQHVLILDFKSIGSARNALLSERAAVEETFGTGIMRLFHNVADVAAGGWGRKKIATAATNRL